MSTISERIKASSSGTSILLGLAPTTFSLLGPSVGEMAPSSIHRPVLALLLSLGAPAVFPGRFLLWDDPLRAKESLTGSFFITSFPRMSAILISLIEYIFAAGDGVNILHAAYRIGVKAVVSWSCANSFWPLVRVVSSLAIHFIASLSLRTAIHRKKRLSKKGDYGDKISRPGLLSVLSNEVTLSSNSR